MDCGSGESCEPGAAGGDRPPESVRGAVRLMYAGAAASTVNGLAGLLSAPRLIHEAVAFRRPGADPATLHMITLVGLGVVVFGIAAQLALWLVLARANRRGASWARMAGTLYCALFATLITASFALSLAHYTSTTPVRVGASAIIGVIGVAAAASLWQPDAREWFRPKRAAQSPLAWT